MLVMRVRSELQSDLDLIALFVFVFYRDLHANRIFHISDKAFSMMPKLIEL